MGNKNEEWQSIHILQAYFESVSQFFINETNN